MYVAQDEDEIQSEDGSMIEDNPTNQHTLPTIEHPALQIINDFIEAYPNGLEEEDREVIIQDLVVELTNNNYVMDNSPNLVINASVQMEIMEFLNNYNTHPTPVQLENIIQLQTAINQLQQAEPQIQLPIVPEILEPIIEQVMISLNFSFIL
jgi:hypothetical protein